MSWIEFITHMLANTHKIEKVAVLTIDGHPVAVTDDLHVSPEEGKAIVHCITDPARSVSKVHVDNNYYTVFQGNLQTIIGIGPSKERMFVAHWDKDHVVVVFGGTRGHGSFLFELKKNLWAKDHRHMERVPSKSELCLDGGQGQGQIHLDEGQGQIQQILQAAEEERMASQEAEDMSLPENIDQIADSYLDNQTTDDNQILIQMHD